MPDIDKFVTAREAADTLGIRPVTVRAAIKSGSLKSAFRVGQLHLISQAEVERYRREHLGRRRGAKAKEVA